MVTSRDDLDVSELRSHVVRDHRDVEYPAADDGDLLSQHLRSHVHRYSPHVHDTPVVEFRIGGPLTSVQPEGWLTGKNALAREAWLAGLREARR